MTDGFLRGLHRVDPDTLLAGDENRLHLLRKQPGGTEAVEHSLRVSEDPQETIFDIKTVPPSFAPLPPDLFAEAPAF